MIKTFKKINNILRIAFIGFTGIFALVKILGARSEKNSIAGGNDTEHITSEFDEIW